MCNGSEMNSGCVRRKAAFGIGRQADERAYDTMIDILDKDESSEIRGAAILALGHLGTDRSVDKVIECLKDDSAVIRENASTGLGKSKNKKAIELLVEAILDSEPAVRESAITGLVKLTDQKDIYE